MYVPINYMHLIINYVVRPKILCSNGKGTASKLKFDDNPQSSLLHMGEIRKPLDPNQTSQLGDIARVTFILWKIRNSL